MPRRPFILILAGLSLLTPGCVTEQPRPSRGTPVSPNPGAKLPPAPVAHAATNASTVTARAQVGLQPLGGVLYDGQTLPLCNPSGTMIAVQSSDAPSWATVLAEPGQEPAPGAKLRTYAIDEKSMHAVEGSEARERGLILGRGADAKGYLAERPKPDGSRAIAKVDWLTGDVAWLVDDQYVNAFATLTPGAALAYSRRAVGGADWKLVLRTGAGESEASPSEGGYVYPIPCADDRFVHTLWIHPGGLELVTLRLEGDAGRQRLGSVVARRPLSGEATILAAHQLAATARGATVGKSDVPVPAASVIIFHPQRGRMTVFDPSLGTLTPLAAKSYAAVASPDPSGPGYYCSTPAGLVFVPWGAKGAASEGATLLDEPFVGLVSIADQNPWVLLVGPARGQPDRLSVVRMYLRTNTP